MKEILTIAESTWKGILKMKVVYFLVICVWILIGSMYRYNEISLDRHRELMLDMAMFLNQLAGILTVLSLTFDIPRELREGIAATFLTKSLGRTKYLLGKTLGVYVVALVVNVLIGAGSYFIYEYCFDQAILQNFIKIELLIMMGVIPMAAVCVFCAVVLPEMAAPIIALLGIWFATLTRHVSIPVLSGGILPDLELFNLKEHIIYPVEIPWSYLCGTFIWGVAYAVFLLMLSGIIFRFKDIK